MKKLSPLDTTIRIQTPENVEIVYPLAGLTMRLQAYLLDLFLSYAVIFAIWFVIGWTVFAAGLDAWGFSLILVTHFFVSWGYWIVSEGCFNGKTLGKYILGLRVISVDGTPITMTHSVLRNLLRAVDCQPGYFYQIAFWSSVTTNMFQRLGDLAAGTVVIQETKELRATSLLNKAPAVKHMVELFPADFRLVDSLRRTLTYYMMRRKDLTPARCQVLAKPLADRLTEMFSMPPELDPDMFLCAAYERLVLNDWENVDLLAENEQKQRYLAEMERVQKERLAAQGALYDPTQMPLLAAQAADTDFEEEMAAPTIGSLNFLREKMQTWKSLDFRCDRVNSMVRYLPREERLQMAADYRSTESDVAMKEAFHLEPRTVTSLENLLGRVYQTLYRSKSRGMKYWMKLIFRDGPRWLFTDAYIWACLVLFWGFFLGCMFLTSSGTFPKFAESVVGKEQLEHMRDMYKQEIGSREDRHSDEVGYMAGFYLWHNTNIGIRCFAMGMLGGITGILVMLFNAITLGTVFGYMGTVPEWGNFSNFVTAHGPCELTAVVVGAAAGARIGFALLVTGGFCRRDSVRMAAITAMPAIIMFIMLFFTAAFIEGFISPSRLPYEVKTLVALVSGTLIFLYFFGLGGAGTLLKWWRPDKENREEEEMPEENGAKVNGLLNES